MKPIVENGHRGKIVRAAGASRFPRFLETQGKCTKETRTLEQTLRQDPVASEQQDISGTDKTHGIEWDLSETREKRKHVATRGFRRRNARCETILSPGHETDACPALRQSGRRKDPIFCRRMRRQCCRV